MIIKLLVTTIALEFKCAYSHLKDLGEIGNKKIRILAGGINVSLEAYPYNVKFFNGGDMCGGVILSKKIVLTAAHCFDVGTNIAQMRIISNSEKIYDRKERIHSVWDYVIHEKYNTTVMYSHDIALILIHDEFTYGSKVQKAMLTDTNIWMNENETEFIATGWGEGVEPESKKDRKGLQKTHLRYISKEKCIIMANLGVSPDMFCLYGDGVRDTCRGDSGGGIMWNEQVVGVVSHGRGCVRGPGVYANVYYFNDWIRMKIEKLYKKYCDFHHEEMFQG